MIYFLFVANSPFGDREGGGGKNKKRIVATIRGGDWVHTKMRTRSTLKNYMHRGQQTDKQTSRLYERIGLRADSLKI